MPRLICCYGRSPVIDIREVAIPMTVVAGGVAAVWKGGQWRGEFDDLKRRVSEVESRQLQAVSRQELDLRFAAIDEKLNLLIKLFSEK